MFRRSNTSVCRESTYNTNTADLNPSVHPAVMLSCIQSIFFVPARYCIIAVLPNRCSAGRCCAKRKGGKKPLAKVCYLCPVPHGGVLQNRWMEALERLWSSTSGWPRIRHHPLPLFLLLLPPTPSLPSSLRSSPPPSVTSWKLLDWFLSIWDTAAGPTHQLRPVRHLRVVVHFDYRLVVITYGCR